MVIQILILAPKGSGKTTLICNLLMFYKGYFHNIFIFSPSIKSDEKWDYIKGQKLLVENTKLKAWMAAQQQRHFDDNMIVSRPPVNLESKGITVDGDFDPYIPEENFISVYDPEYLKELMIKQQQTVDFLKDNGKTKHLSNRMLFIFDDPIGSGLFDRNARNPYKQFSTIHRHLNISSICVSQGYKEIPKTIRSNFTCMIIFEISNDSELQEIYKENTIGCKEHEWLEIYKHCTEPAYGFMFFNHQKKRNEGRIMKNFQRYIYLAKEEE